MAKAAANGMKMAELERRTGVGRETIRFYIREGLLPAPERRGRNVAVYGDVHVQRVKAIKRLQEERFLPLGVIRDVLNGDLGALPAAADPFAQLAPLLAARLGVGVGEPAVDLDTLVAGDAQTARDVAGLEAIGAITVQVQGKGRAVSRLDARIVALWRDLRRAGYGPEAFPVDQVQIYLDALNPVIAVEVERFFTGFEGVDGADVTELAEAGVELVNALIGALRTKFILQAVDARTRRAPPAPAGTA